LTQKINNFPGIWWIGFSCTHTICIQLNPVGQIPEIFKSLLQETINLKKGLIEFFDHIPNINLLFVINYNWVYHVYFWGFGNSNLTNYLHTDSCIMYYYRLSVSTWEPKIFTQRQCERTFSMRLFLVPNEDAYTR